MKGDDYVPGALVLAHSLKKVNTKHKIICLVTHDVSSNAKNQLLKIFDEVINVDYITSDVINMGFIKSDSNYVNWINQVFTKYQVISQYNYRKILFIDADMIVMKNIDFLFDYDTPVCIFSSWANIENHNKLVPNKIKLSKLNKHPFRGSIWMITPNEYDYNGILYFLENYKKMVDFETQAGPDEFILQMYYWNNLRTIHRGFSVPLYSYKKYGLSINDVYVIDFIGEKPWNSKKTEYEDVQLFYSLYNELLKEYNILNMINNNNS
jgi:lipopolysaccharide biosynthesis glycosyltransferase